MEETLFTILTDEGVRTTNAIEMSLDHAFTAGIPWFDRAPLDI